MSLSKTAFDAGNSSNTVLLFLNRKKINHCNCIIYHKNLTSRCGLKFKQGHRGGDRTVVGFTTTGAISAYHH